MAPPGPRLRKKLRPPGTTKQGCNARYFVPTPSGNAWTPTPAPWQTANGRWRESPALLARADDTALREVPGRLSALRQHLTKTGAAVRALAREMDAGAAGPQDRPAVLTDLRAEAADQVTRLDAPEDALQAL